ncbi:hypothetical protein [Sporosarcina ureae]|uniref:hypothetical protein n=1 Tax=Sporosarcina ureae TaxID=1571 RepID=UPI000A17E2C1|nr:hypothetical protein [Sporosarcina ureae]ARK21359.1 hypothetical protein SporoP32a_07325 [Sporosarcina ureae]
MSYVLGAILELKDKAFTSGVKESASATGKLRDELDRTGNSGSAFGSGLKKAGKTAAIGIAAIGTASIAAGTAAFAMTKKVTDGFDHVAKTSRKMGVSSDFYQEMDYWAGQNGVSQNNMEKSMQRLNQRVGEARSGNDKYSGALKSLGVDMNAVKDGTLSTEDAMSQSISALSKMTNEQDKAALASELFGTKLAQELMPAIQDGSLSMKDAKKNAKELGFVIGEDTLGAAEKFNDTWDDLTRGVQAFGVKAIAGMMPFFQGVMEFATDKLPAAQAMFTTVFDGIGTAIGWLGDKGTYVFNAIKDAVMDNQPALESVKSYYTKLWEKTQDLYDAAKPLFTWMGEEGIPIVVDALADLVEGAFDVYNVIIDNWSKIEPFVIGIATAFGVWKLATMAQSAVTGIAAAKQWLLNAAMTANPVGLVITAFGILIGVGILVYKNWDKIKAAAVSLWKTTKEKFASMKENILTAMQPVLDFFGKLKDKWDDFKSSVSNFKMPKIGIPKVFGGDGLIQGSHATGLRRVPYDGYVAELHKDEQILPKSEAERYRKSKGNVVENTTSATTINKNKYVSEMPKYEAVLPRPKAESYRGNGVINNNTSATTTTKNESKWSINIAKLADHIVVKEESDIDKITTMLVKKLEAVDFNMV